VHNNYIVESEVRIPVVDQVDVVVAGGGPAGIGAVARAYKAFTVGSEFTTLCMKSR